MAKVGQLMQELRDKLDDLDISWYDDSDRWDGVIVERTRIEPLRSDGALTSVIYIYDTRDGVIGMSYGYPNKLECWNMNWSEDPEPMSVSDIIWKLVNDQPSKEISDGVSGD